MKTNSDIFHLKKIKKKSYYKDKYIIEDVTLLESKEWLKASHIF
jgi:hypothetical protein